MARPCLVMDLAVPVRDALRNGPEGVYVEESEGWLPPLFVLVR